MAAVCEAPLQRRRHVQRYEQPRVGLVVEEEEERECMWTQWQQIGEKQAGDGKWSWQSEDPSEGGEGRRPLGSLRSTNGWRRRTGQARGQRPAQGPLSLVHTSSSSSIEACQELSQQPCFAVLQSRSQIQLSRFGEYEVITSGYVIRTKGLLYIAEGSNAGFTPSHKRMLFTTICKAPSPGNHQRK
ncbi:hypothetical protein JOB18_042295 [Solea senegalensis]|uniref:Uncharacterized protein n=1 Tax=Solea senegalensis TaxID=28829 RepID=A0AAV6SB64_SOLSE|nr:hypothetical protein JOB18_042295 [Solea senegalensis]